MRFVGKLIGAIAGYLLLRHPFGALLGLALGHAFDAGWLRASAPPPPPAPGPRPEPDLEAYAVLGLDPGASDEKIERTWRQLMGKYHPDRVAGAADEIRALAELRSREINSAYDRIREERRARR